jgi:hypothetical protein
MVMPLERVRGHWQVRLLFGERSFDIAREVLPMRSSSTNI